MKNPWDRQDGETSKAYDYFRDYLALGPHRTIKLAAESKGFKPDRFRRWSRIWNWRQRALAWDDEQDRLEIVRLREMEAAEDKAARESIKKMHTRYQHVGEAMIKKAAADLVTMTKPKCPQCGAGKTRLTPDQMAKFITAGSRLERLGYGLSSDGASTNIQINNNNLTQNVTNINPISVIKDEEARRLNNELLRRLAVIDREQRTSVREQLSMKVVARK